MGCESPTPQRHNAVGPWGRYKRSLHTAAPADVFKLARCRFVRLGRAASSCPRAFSSSVNISTCGLRSRPERASDMHPQAPNTQTFLPACLLPTACDYNGLDCFDPLERKMTYYYQEATRNSPRRYIPHGLPRGLCATAPAPLLGEKANEIRRRGLQYSRAYLAASLEAQRLKDSNRHTHATP